jgi:hypothetical protein
VRAALTFSLWIALAGLAFAGQYADLSDRAKNTPSDQAAIQVVKSDPLTKNDPEVRQILASGDDAATKAESLKDLLELRALIESPSDISTSTAAEVRTIKDSFAYRDPGESETSNWLSRALDRLKNIRLKPPDAPKGNLPTLSIGPWFAIGMWGLLAAVAGFLIYLAVKHIRWQRKVARKASALLDEDEPALSLDEWLREADDLAAKGRYREAVRALYLACLLRFDEERVARFQRGQTNWEHLARIEASPLLPASLDFRTPTRLFDRVWYGHIVRGREDVDAFRATYLEVTGQLQRKVAA